MRGKKDQMWWEHFPLDLPVVDEAMGVGPCKVRDLAEEFLLRQALAGGLPLRKSKIDAGVNRDFFVHFQAELTRRKAKLITEITETGEPNREEWVWTTGCLSISFDRHDSKRNDGDDEDDGPISSGSMISLEVVSCDVEDLTDFERIIEVNRLKWMPTPVPAGQAFVLCETSYGITLEEIGLAGAPLVRDNYTKSVLKAYDMAVKDMKSDKPRGRLAVLDGPPGTGKTFMVRGFMEAVPESKFVVVPPGLVKRLADPNLILTFIRELHVTGRPIILILEDADQCLSKRKAENMESISSILNLTDGIVGSLLDLRVLATTNTPAQEFDEALLRKGRMSAHIRLEGLTTQEIGVVWKNLAGPKEPLPDPIIGKKTVVLADVYASYNDLPEVDKALGEIAKISN